MTDGTGTAMATAMKEPVDTAVTLPSSSASTQAADSKPVPEAFLKELCSFRDDCQQRYRFNSRYDNVLNVLGILLSVGIVAAGAYDQAKIAAILGGFVAAAVTAQRAFP